MQVQQGLVRGEITTAAKEANPKRCFRDIQETKSISVGAIYFQAAKLGKPRRPSRKVPGEVF